MILGKSCLGSMRDRFEFHEILVHRSAIFFEIVEIFFVFLLRIYIYINIYVSGIYLLFIAWFLTV